MKGKGLSTALKLAVALAATSVGVEAGSRAIERIRGEPFDPEAMRARIEGHLEAVSPRALIRGGHQDETRVASRPKTDILNPYTAWEQLLTQVQIAEDRAFADRPESEETVDVFVLGGSVAHGFGNMGAEPFVEIVRRDPRFADRPFRVRNYALGGYKQLQQVMLLGYLLDWGLRPDLVVEIDGFNEAALGEANARIGAHPAYPALPYWASAAYGLRTDYGMIEILHGMREKQDRAVAFGRRLLDWGVWRSSFLGRAGSTVLAGLRREYIDQFYRYQQYVADTPRDLGSKGPRFDPDGDAVSETIVLAWEESSISMDAMCRARGITYLHVLQPALHDRGSKPLTQKERDAGQAVQAWIEGIHRTYPRLRRAGKRLADRGIAFVDASDVFRDHEEDIYVDACHFLEHGNALLAERVAAAFLETAPR